MDETGLFKCQFMFVQSNLSIVVTWGRMTKWPLYTGDLYMEGLNFRQDIVHLLCLIIWILNPEKNNTYSPLAPMSSDVPKSGCLAISRTVAVISVILLIWCCLVFSCWYWCYYLAPVVVVPNDG
jgi:hypothetical protein